MKSQLRNRLSQKLLRTVLLAALLLGLVMSLTQIVFDIQRTRQLIEHDARRVLRMARDPATQAIYSLDREMGAQVVGGLLQHDSIRLAAIGHPGEETLALAVRPPKDMPTRHLTDPLLGREHRFSIALLGRSPDNEHYGDLAITLDTADYGAAFLRDSVVIFVLGVTRALILAFLLYLIYQWLLTRPLVSLIEHLARIDPKRPGQHTLPMPRGHEDNELGLWVQRTNALLAAIEHHMQRWRKAEDHLLRLARHDLLTGLPNRQHLQEQLDGIIAEARARQSRVAVFCIGLDDFKGINERYGYQTGDRLLVLLAGRLQARGIRLSAHARLGGDEFALIQANITHPYEAAEMAERILAEVESPFTLEHLGVRLKATVGITLHPEDGDAAEQLLQKAEQTMTLAKRNTRSRYQFYVASIDSQMRQRRELQEQLGEALERNEFHLVFQPQVDLQQRRTVGFEALLRWQHPQRGLVPPDLFIPLAEQNGSIIRIGEWVLDRACRQLRQWHDQGLDTRMAVNLSTIQLYHDGTPQLIGRLLRQYALPAESLEVEVTETVLMEDVAGAADVLHSLRERGVRIAIDDFGTGYSSLSYLRSLPVDKIKIDKSFVRDLGEDAEAAPLVRAIIQLGMGLGMQVIAEGVETAAQEGYLIEQGCHEGQGYYYSRPLPAEEVGPFLQRFAAARLALAE